MTNTTNTMNPPRKKAANIKVDKLRTFEGHPFKVSIYVGYGVTQ